MCKCCVWMCVVYFDQQTGTPHAVRWSKSFVSAWKLRKKKEKLVFAAFKTYAIMIRVLHPHLFIERSAAQHRHLILCNECSHSEHIFETNTHCYYSMKYRRNWWNSYATSSKFDHSSPLCHTKIAIHYPHRSRLIASA